MLDRKLGLPITLAIVYMEVAQRIGFPLFGVGMPGHFLLKHYDVAGDETFIDPFHRGDILSRADCQSRLNEIYSGEMPLQPEFLLTVTRRQLLTRVLANLRNIYMERRDFRRALVIVDLVLAIHPRSAEDMKQRAMLRYALNQLRGAEDLETYPHGSRCQRRGRNAPNCPEPEGAVGDAELKTFHHRDTEAER